MLYTLRMAYMYSRESRLLLGELLVLKVLGDEGIKDGGLEELAVAWKRNKILSSPRKHQKFSHCMPEF